MLLDRTDAVILQKPVSPAEGRAPNPLPPHPREPSNVTKLNGFIVRVELHSSVKTISVDINRVAVVR